MHLVLRCLVLYLLLLGIYLYLKELVSLPFWTLAFLGGALIGWWMGVPNLTGA